MFMLGVLGNAAAQTDGKDKSTSPVFTYDQYEITVGEDKYQTFLTGDLLGDSFLEIAVASRDKGGNSHLTVYSFENGSWEKMIDSKLPESVLFIDVANIGGQDRLLAYEEGLFSWFDPEQETFQDLVSFSFGYKGTVKERIPWVNLTKDLNHDKLDDFIIPGLDAFSILIQKTDGTFSDPVRMGPPEPFLESIAFDDNRTYGQVGLNARTIRWYLGRVQYFDYNLDGRKDLVFWNRDHFDVHLQDENGQFDPEIKSFSTDVPFDTDAPYSFLFGFDKDENAFTLVLGLRKRTDHTILDSFLDMNGDGVTDMLTHTLRGRSVLKLRSQYKVHFGTAGQDGIHFEAESKTAAFPKGRAGAGAVGGYSNQWLKDLDGDGQIDVMRNDVKIGIGSIIAVFITQSVKMNFEAFRLDGNSFHKRANRTIKTGFEIYKEEGGFFPAVLVGDVNGDGRMDMLVGENREVQKVYLGVSGPDLFTKQPQRVRVSVPASGEHTWLVDINKDGKEDIFMYHPGIDQLNRLLILVGN